MRFVRSAASRALSLLRVARRLRARSVVAIVVGAAAVAAATWFLLPQEVPSFEQVRSSWKPSDAYLLDRHGEVIDQVRVDFKVRRFEWTPLESVSPALTAAIVDGEDRRFWAHRGVDWTALLGALRDNGVSQRRRGASTISMQVAALLDPRVRARASKGAWLRKLEQLRLARALEGRWSKPQILEAYLNLLGFRGELQGIGAASHVLVGKSPSGLTLPESLVLAALLPSPAASTDRVVSRACARATARHLSVTCAEIASTAADTLPAPGTPRSQYALTAAGNRRHAAAGGWAPHLAQSLLSKPGEHVTTTLDAATQRIATTSLRNHLSKLTARNVRDGAVLIANTTTGEILAYVASATATSRSRNVDGIRAHRQAGSTLKPFLYELALERHYLTAASLLNDEPITLDTASGIYLPQNYDRDFKGLVSVRTALGNSLNVPAVRTLMLTGVEPFRQRLHQLGYAGITQPGDFYGYSLALGSAEVSLWEQVQAYRTLARGGRFSPLTLQPGAHETPDQTLLPDSATYIVTDILSDRAARSITFGLDNHLNTPFWSAVKTGTSKDMRDNWCIGFSSHFTVGVWVGNFEGDSMHDVSGVTGAAPIWQETMMALHARIPSEPPKRPLGVTVQTARFSPAIEPPRTELFLESQTPVLGQAAGGVAHIDHPTTVQAAADIARIDSPANGMIIAIDPDIPLQFQRVPLTARGADPRMVIKLNDKVLGPANRNVLWVPEPGSHLIALEDSTGHTLDSARFVVR